MAHRIFLVEDNPLIRRTMTEMLEDIADVEVIAWADGETAAVAEMGHTDWDVALIDLFLAEGSGLGVVRAFQQRPSARKLYVVSNYATAEIRKRCWALGVDGIFDKSTELDSLVDRLQAC